MAYQLCEKMRELVPYDPIEGEYRIRLDANESYFLPDEALKKELAAAAAAVAFNRYPDPYASELCRAFAELYGVPVSAVTAGNGSDELISLICGSLLQKGERILTFAPDFSMYRFYGEIFEDRVDVLQKERDLSVDVDQVIRFVRENGVRAVIFSNPCNPTGQGMSKKAVRKLVSSVDALVVLDEAYMDFWDQSILDCSTALENGSLHFEKTGAFGALPEGADPKRTGASEQHRRSGKAVPRVGGSVSDPYELRVSSVGEKPGDL